jgi:hypothetical protein
MLDESFTTEMISFNRISKHRSFLRGLSTRVLELEGGAPQVYPPLCQYG